MKTSRLPATMVLFATAIACSTPSDSDGKKARNAPESEPPNEPATAPKSEVPSQPPTPETKTRSETAAPKSENPVNDLEIDADGLQVRLDQEDKHSTVVRLTVENPTSAPKVFCDYHTPFEGIRNNIFVVEKRGKEVPYIGKMVKRAPPDNDDFITVAPAESKSATVDLANGYELVSGEYKVRFRGTGISGLPDSNTLSLSQ